MACDVYAYLAAKLGRQPAKRANYSDSRGTRVQVGSHLIRSQEKKWAATRRIIECDISASLRQLWGGRHRGLAHHGLQRAATEMGLETGATRPPPYWAPKSRDATGPGRQEGRPLNELYSRSSIGPSCPLDIGRGAFYIKPHETPNSPLPVAKSTTASLAARRLAPSCVLIFLRPSRQIW